MLTGFFFSFKEIRLMLLNDSKMGDKEFRFIARAKYFKLVFRQEIVIEPIKCHCNFPLVIKMFYKNTIYCLIKIIHKSFTSVLFL